MRYLIATMLPDGFPVDCMHDRWSVLSRDGDSSVLHRKGEADPFKQRS
jgi:hypothetical protein